MNTYPAELALGNDSIKGQERQEHSGSTGFLEEFFIKNNLGGEDGEISPTLNIISDIEEILKECDSSSNGETSSIYKSSLAEEFAIIPSSNVFNVKAKDDETVEPLMSVDVA